MGTLWVARHLGAGSLVAIKFMAPDISWAESARARFRREAWAAARIDSPHVVQVFDHGVHDEQLFLVMELLDGEDLSSRLKRCGALPLREAAWVLVQAARGLAQAHELGIVHRDLKPANLFLARGPGAVETVKILDFGIAKALFDGGAGDPTATGEILGSPEYMSPEQALGNAVDHRSDLWSLALVLYRMLAGRNAFEGQGISALLSMLQGGAPPLSGIVAGLPILLDRFFERALARDTAHRFQSAQELAAATALIAGLPVDELRFERPARSPLSETDELPSLALLLGNSPSTVPPRSGLVRRDGADDEDEADQPTRVDRKRERREDGTLVSGETGPQGAPQIPTKDPASGRGR
jgi:serine/threonine-protein kinase